MRNRLAKFFKEKESFPVKDLDGYTCILEVDDVIQEKRVTVRKQEAAESVSTFPLKLTGEERKEDEYLEMKLKEVFQLGEEDITKIRKQIGIIKIRSLDKATIQYPFIPSHPYGIAKQAAETKIVGEDELVDQIHHIFLSAYTNNPLNGCLRGPTAEGKSWPALAVARLYPSEDLFIYAGASPKSFIQDNFTLVNE